MNAKLREIFSPRSVAVIGALNSADRVGYHVMKSLVEGNYKGQIFPVNSEGRERCGMNSYPALGEIADRVDLALIMAAPPLLPQILHECGKKMVKGVVLITAGVREIEDATEKVRQEEIGEIARQYGLPIIGPTAFGFINRTFEVNATFIPELSQLKKGGVALISQSGEFCNLWGSLAIKYRMGISKMIGLGNRVNVGFPELLRHLAEDDEKTGVVVLYIEELDEPRNLFDTAKSLRGRKHLVAYKAGKGGKGQGASQFHTEWDEYRIWKGMFHQAGILEAASAEELIDMAKILDACPRIKGPRIAVLSAQAGPGIIAADAVEKAGLKLARFSAQTQNTINGLIPPHTIRTNPVDMGPIWLNAGNSLDILKAALEDDGTDGVIFIAIFASANVHFAKCMAEYIEGADPFEKPVIAIFTAPPGIWEDEIAQIDGRKGVSILSTPERAGAAMGNLWRENLFLMK